MTFYKAFKQNMDALGMPVPTGLFSGVTITLITIDALSKVVENYPKHTTIRHLIRASRISPAFRVAAAVTASFYLGAIIGSFLVATHRVSKKGKKFYSFPIAKDALLNHRVRIPELLRDPKLRPLIGPPLDMKR